MTTLQASLASLEPDEPSWLHAVEHVEPVPARTAAEFLNGLEREDFGLFVLAYGMGMRLGEISQALRLDPALVVWRLRRALQRRPEARSDSSLGALELGVSRLLREPDAGAAAGVPKPTHGQGSWSLPALIATLDDEVQARLQARLASPVSEPTRAGVGVGVVVLVLLFAAGFMVFGAIRDVNPLWRGKSLMQEGQFAAAREALASYWDPVLADEQIALCHLALGEFDAALALIARPEVRERFGPFAPLEEEPTPLDTEPGSRALLPRGLIRTSRPTFVYKAGPAGKLAISVGWGDQTLGRMIDIPDTRNGPPVVRMAYPEAWPTLPPEMVVWAVTDPEMSQADFTCMDQEERLEVKSDCMRFLDRSVPAQAHWFFRGHYYMRKQLYTQAGEQFAMLARIFKNEDYPRRMVEQVSRVLGVDPSAFLR